MIKDFDLEVKSQLDSDEKIENSFKVRNESTLSGSVDMSVSPALAVNGTDFSFFYQFIITIYYFIRAKKLEREKVKEN